MTTSRGSRNRWSCSRRESCEALAEEGLRFEEPDDLEERDDFGFGLDFEDLLGGIGSSSGLRAAPYPSPEWRETRRSSSAFCAWRRFSAWSQIRWRSP